LSWLRGILAHVLADQIRRYYGTGQRDPKLERALEFEFERSSERFARALVPKQASFFY
jgi:hypothetical protein